MVNNISFGSNAGVNLYGAAREFKKGLQEGTITGINKSYLETSNQLLQECSDMTSFIPKKPSMMDEQEIPYEKSSFKGNDLIKGLAVALTEFKNSIVSRDADSRDKDWFAKTVVLLNEKNPVIVDEPPLFVSQKPSSGIIDLTTPYSKPVKVEEDDSRHAYPSGTRYAVFSLNNIEY